MRGSKIWKEKSFYDFCEVQEDRINQYSITNNDLIKTKTVFKVHVIVVCIKERTYGLFLVGWILKIIKKNPEKWTYFCDLS